MKAIDLLDALGEARSDFIMEAQHHREHKAVRRRRSPLKVLLIAAILMALLTGCAVVYMLRLDNMKMGTEVFADIHDIQPKAHTVLSLQGVVGSDNYNAAKEWYEFCQSYEQDYNTTVPLTEEEEEIYGAYFCNDREMADKVDEITQKYGLELHGKRFIFQNAEEIYELLGIRDILKDGVNVENGSRSGYFYADGTFNVEGYMTLTGLWPHELIYGYRCTMKNVFDDVYSLVEEDKIVDQWNYTTSDGSELLLVLYSDGANICANRQDSFLHISLNHAEYPTPDFNMDRTTLERIADSLNLTLAPKPLDEASYKAAQEREGQAQKEWREQHPSPDRQPNFAGYARYYFDWLEMNKYFQIQNGTSVWTDYESYYTIRDINGDGEGELLIYRENSIDEIVTLIDGVTFCITDRPGSERTLGLCENDNFILRFISVDGPEMCTIYRYKGDREQNIKYMMHKDDGWYDCPSMNPISDEAYDTKLTDEQFEEILSAYPPIDLSTLNLRPLKELASS